MKVHIKAVVYPNESPTRIYLTMPNGLLTLMLRGVHLMRSWLLWIKILEMRVSRRPVE